MAMQPISIGGLAPGPANNSNPQVRLVLIILQIQLYAMKDSSPQRGANGQVVPRKNSRGVNKNNQQTLVIAAVNGGTVGRKHSND